MELVISSEQSDSGNRRKLGIKRGTLANWVNTGEEVEAKGEQLDTSERARLRELEEGTRGLKMERDFLKKSSGRRLRRRISSRSAF